MRVTRGPKENRFRPAIDALARGRGDVARAGILESRAMDCDDKGRVIRALLQDPPETERERAAAELDV